MRSLLAAVIAASLLSCRPTPAAPVHRDPPPADPHHLAPLARRIVTRIAALGARIPSLAGASSELRAVYSIDASSTSWEPRFWARWQHEHGVSWEPDPTYVPSPYTARSPNRMRLDPRDGLVLDVYLYEGAWDQLLTVTPVELGRLRVVTLVNTPNPALRAALERAITEILDSERAALDAGAP